MTLCPSFSISGTSERAKLSRSTTATWELSTPSPSLTRIGALLAHRMTRVYVFGSGEYELTYCYSILVILTPTTSVCLAFYAASLHELSPYLSKKVQYNLFLCAVTQQQVQLQLQYLFLCKHGKYMAHFLKLFCTLSVLERLHCRISLNLLEHSPLSYFWGAVV